VRKLLVVAVVLTLLAVTGLMLTPASLVNTAAAPVLPDDLDSYVAEHERSAGAEYPLIRGTEKRISWQVTNQKTEYAVVYLPGFSATRQEIAPTAELVADALGANLFETRLRGHGRIAGAMFDVQAEDWLEDAAEALAIGAQIGDKIVLIGTSTGATLALAMAGHPGMQYVETLVLISPNFAPHDPASQWLTRPAGPLLARLMMGETRTWQPHNELQAQYWSTSYPTETLVEVMRLVDLAHEQLPLSLDQSLLTLMSLNDTVVSPQTTLEALEQIGAIRSKTVLQEQVGDPSNHVLAGDILSPENTVAVAATIVAFVRGDD